MKLIQIIVNTIDALLLRGNLENVFSIAVRQMACGTLGALVDICIFQTVLNIGVFDLHGAINSGFIISFFVVYFANKYYTFNQVKKFNKNTLLQILLFFCASLVSLGLNHVIVRFLVKVLDFMPIIARVISIVIVFFYSFFVNRRFIFSSIKQKQ